MKIKDIKPNMENITVEGVVERIIGPTIIQTRFGPTLFAVAVLSDETGKIRLNLWRWQAKEVREGDKLKIINGFTKSFKGNIELNVGSKGRIIKLK